MSAALTVNLEGASTLTLTRDAIVAQWDRGRGRETWRRPSWYDADAWREVYFDMLESWGRTDDEVTA